MKILHVSLVLLFLCAVTYIQVRKLVNKHERRSAIVYFVLMAIVASMYALVFLSEKLVHDPINLLTIPLENIGKSLLKEQ